MLDETHHKRLGLFETTRYPELDPSPERTLRSELQAVLLSGQAPTDFVASLLGLLVPMDLVGRLVDRTERKAAKARAKDVAERGPVGDAVKTAVQQQIAAVVAAPPPPPRPPPPPPRPNLKGTVPFIFKTGRKRGAAA